MDYYEAEAIIKDAGLYASADFYRMQTSLTIALGLRDEPIRILADVVNHGTDEARALLKYALECGYLTQRQEGEYLFYDVIDVEESGAPYYFRSHIAMQIAYPHLYWDFFDGEHVWTFSHPKMQHLIDLCVSCVTNKKHPSDYYGEHEIPDDKPKVGRPKLPPAEKKVKVRDAAFTRWIAACQEYKHAVSAAWKHYQDECAHRKEMERQGKEWLNNELDRLRAEMARVSEQYQDGMKVFDQRVESALAAHTELKAQGKPKRDDFE